MKLLLSKMSFVLHIYLLIVLQNCGYLIVVGLYLFSFVMSHFDARRNLLSLQLHESF